MNLKRYIVPALAFLCTGFVFADYDTEAFFEICADGTAAEVLSAIAEGADVNADDDEGITALMYALKNDNRETANALLEAGADVNAADEDGITVLMYAAFFSSDAATVSKLLDAADINARDDSEKTVLMLATNNSFVLPLLLAAGADVNAVDSLKKTALMYAAAFGNTKTVLMLLDSGADLSASDYWGYTVFDYARKLGIENSERRSVSAALIAAAKARGMPLEDAGEDFVDNETDDTYEDSDNERFLEICSYGSTVNILTAIDNGADVNMQDSSGWTPLMSAATDNNASAVKALIDAGADINAADSDDWTPLICAAISDNARVVKILIGSGADIDARDLDGCTPLIFAARNENEKIIQLLLEAGADASIRDNEGMNALDHANKNSLAYSLLAERISDTDTDSDTDDDGYCSCGCGDSNDPDDDNYCDCSDMDTESDVIYDQSQLFGLAINGTAEDIQDAVESGADLDYPDPQGITALMYAVRFNNENTLKTLIAAGADVNAADDDDVTALMYAARHAEDSSLLKALIDAGANVNAVDFEGSTALMYAAWSFEIDKAAIAANIAVLLNAGADSSIREFTGRRFTALEYARANRLEGTPAYTLLATAQNAAKEKTPSLVYPRYYTVGMRRGITDMLYRIAALPGIYNDPSLWTLIYEANKSKLTNPDNPHLILEGTVLEIPSLKGEPREGNYIPTQNYPPINN
ncbi:MAG: ankyrin repeat domain-containing protein [Spirochaetaceae bacterium]|jgi:ankyrin repeat protein|nr:ankyrin repeat domain-containing protein [Spirochaetaceae bacterium]